jgi:hypothetical protein
LVSTQDVVTIVLSKDIALILFEFLSRSSESERLEISHKAEETALWKLEAALEKILVEPLSPNYLEALEAARRRVTGEP